MINEGTSIICNTGAALLNDGGIAVMQGGYICDTTWDTSSAVGNIGGGIFKMYGGLIEANTSGIVNDGGEVEITNASVSVRHVYPAVINRSGKRIYIYNSYIWSNNIAYSSECTEGIVSFNCAESGYIIGTNVLKCTHVSGGLVIRLYGRETSESISCYTWTENNGQDDLLIYNSVNETTDNGQAKRMDIYISNHNNETGLYFSDLYLSGGNLITGLMWYP